MSYDVFISHCAEDRAIAEAACAALERAGHLCWFAPRDGGNDGEPMAARFTAISRSKVCLLILSGGSARSPEVEREAERARSAGLGIIPFRIEDVAPGEGLHYQIAGAIVLDAVQPPLDDHLDHLSAIVGRMLDGGEDAPLRPLTLPPQPMARRRAMPSWLPIVIAGLIGLVAIALAALAVRR